MPILKAKINHRVSKIQPSFLIITPSLNQARYVHKTIQSVLSQDNDHFTYVVVDGGSSDGSRDIIKRYQEELTYIHHENDRGQASAINKGFRNSSGDILAWINSDDYYLPGAFKIVGDYFATNPHIDVAYGDIILVDSKGNRLGIRKSVEFDLRIALYSECLIPQPATFWRREVLESIGFLDEALEFQMDYEYFLRMAAHGCSFGLIPEPLAAFRLHSSSKTVRKYDDKFFESSLHIKNKYRKEYLNAGNLHPLVYRLLKSFYRAKIYLQRIIQRGDLQLPFRVTRLRQKEFDSQ